jgi:DnaK suppressor protein
VNIVAGSTQAFYTDEQLKMFERLLQGQRHELIEEAGKTVSELTDQVAEFADPGDRASWESESTRDLRIRDRERKLVEKIDEALARITEGTFGECDECGELIGIGRLRARPVTTYCIACKEEQEAEENKPNHA